MGSVFGQKLAESNDFLELFIPHNEMQDVLNKLEKINTKEDDNFKPFLKNILTEWDKKGYADEIEDDIESYHESINSLKTILKKANDEKKGFIVLVSY